MPTLRDALGIGDREVVAFVGAGGKTSAMFRLARELRSAGAGVVITTTTRILVPPESAEIRVAVAERGDDLADSCAVALGLGQILVVARCFTPDLKLAGIAAEAVADLAALDGVTHVLVEADGAARMPLKGPRPGEPVIPPSATLVVPVVGIDALGHPVTAVSHRPERVTALTGLRSDEPLDARAIARVLLGPDGNTTGAPPNARVIPLVNKADDPARLAAAREVATELRRSGAERVVIAAIEGPRAVIEVVGTVAPPAHHRAR